MKRVLAYLSLLAIVASGCKAKPSVVGDWTSTIMNQTANFHFASDKSMTLEQQSPMGPLKVKGNYAETENTMTWTFTAMDLPAGPEGDIAKKVFEAQKNKPVTFDITWTSPDEISAKATGDAAGAPAAMILTRKKA